MSNSRCEYLIERMGRKHKECDTLNSILRDCQRKRDAAVDRLHETWDRASHGWKMSDQGQQFTERAQREIDHWTDRAVGIQNQLEGVRVEIVELEELIREEQDAMWR